jgi:membrane protease subunit HflK
MPNRPPIGRYVGFALAALLALFVVGTATSAFYTVDANEQAVVLRFGKYHETVDPGAHFRVPFIDQVLTVSTEERTARLPGIEATGDLAAVQLPEDQTLMLTGDLNAATVEWTVQWRVRDAKDFLFAFYDRRDDAVFERVFRTAAQSTMNRLIGDYSVDEVLTDKRAEVGEKARAATQKILDDYHCGVTITGFQMQRVTPPERVKSSFDAVNASIQERDRLENEANKIRNEILPKAKADRDKLIREAEGYADRRRAEVDGEVTALKAKYDAYKLAPKETRRRLYLESLQEVLRDVDQKVILDAEIKNMLPVLPLDQAPAR